MRLKTAFEYAQLGPNKGETAYDAPVIWKPGKLKRSEYGDTAPGVNPDAVRGVAREPEKTAIFDGDGTKLMPHLRAIHKLGGISASEVGIEDLDAIKTTGRHYSRQAQRAFSNKPTDVGPGYEADHDSKSTADDGNEPDSTGDLPIEDPQAGEDTKTLFRKHIKGLRKSAAGVLSAELLSGMPRLDAIAAEQQRQLLSQAVYEARMRGGEMRGAKEPAAIAMAGQKALEGAQYARLVDADVDAINARLARRALEKRSGVLKTAEPPPPPGVSPKVWDKHLEGAKDEGYGLQGSTNVQGLPIAIENRKGSVRSGKSREGVEWRTKMKHPYGYIVGSKGADGEGVDAYVGPNKEAPNAFVVHQRKPDGKGYDEDKVMLGFKSKADAKRAFLQHYDSPKFLGPIKTVPIERLRELVESKKRLVKISFAMPSVEDRGYQKKVRRRFDKLTTALERHGDPVGTGHKRIVIPKKVMKEDDLMGQLGFVPVKVAIPETGQTRFASFRHPHNLLHLHEHGDAWVMHKDEHPASTMLMKKWRMAREAIKSQPGKSKEEINKALKATGGALKPVGDFVRGLPHVVTEGIPGAYYYLKGKVTRGQSMRERVEEAAPSAYKRQINRWAELKKKASAEYADLGSLVQ